MTSLTLFNPNPPSRVRRIRDVPWRVNGQEPSFRPADNISYCYAVARLLHLKGDFVQF